MQEGERFQKTVNGGSITLVAPGSFLNEAGEKIDYKQSVQIIGGSISKKGVYRLPAAMLLDIIKSYQDDKEFAKKLSELSKLN